MSLKYKVVVFSTVVFFVFICWIIIQADSGRPNFFIDNIKHIPLGDKLGHLWLYGALAFMLNFVLIKHSKTIIGLPLGCVLVLAFSLVEELSQSFFSSRTVDLGDAIADVAGVYLAAWLSMRLQTLPSKNA